MDKFFIVEIEKAKLKLKKQKKIVREEVGLYDFYENYELEEFVLKL